MNRNEYIVASTRFSNINNTREKIICRLTHQRNEYRNDTRDIYIDTQNRNETIIKKKKKKRKNE